jgi:multicomponent Na+:H+ antiporter subunit C
VQLLLAITIGVLIACGISLVLRRDLTFVALGIGLLGSGVNLLLLVAGRARGAPALVTDGAAGEAVANPLPQAFVLTAIVIGFAVVALVLAVARRVGARPVDGSKKPNE